MKLPMMLLWKGTSTLWCPCIHLFTF